MKTPSRIVVRGVNWLGDAVMTTPAMLRLRERFPEAHIVLLTHEKLRNLWLDHPAINEVITFAKGDGIFSVAGKLREGRFDLGVVFPNSPRSALESFVARIPNRVGGQWPWRNWLLTRAIPPQPGIEKMRKRTPDEVRALMESSAGSQPRHQYRTDSHQLFHYLHLVAALGANPAPLAPQLNVTENEVQAVRSRFQIGTDKLILGLNAGAEYGPAKRWPAERFIAAAEAIQKQTQCVWLLFGGPGDAALVQPIDSALRAQGVAFHNLASKTSLRELLALLKLCRVVLTNDTGPMHLAAAVGTKVVVPFGSTSPELTGPGLPGSDSHALIKSDAICSPCFLRECPIDFRCMKGIGVDQIVAAVLELAADPESV